MSKILVTGSSSGLGAALVWALKLDGHEILTFDMAHGDDVRDPKARLDEVYGLSESAGELDYLINCAGVNLIGWIPEFTLYDWDTVMDTNAKGVFAMTQALLPALRRSPHGGTVLNIVSNAAHMPMRCSTAYNASKAAALAVTKQMARELSPTTTVFSVSPNKLAGTAMSDSIDEQVVRTRGWTRQEAHDYQVNSMLTKMETPVHLVAEFITYLLSSKENHQHLSGCDMPYGA